MKKIILILAISFLCLNFNCCFAMESPLHGITDVESYNHYFGWYGGSYENNEKWLDHFHEACPDICLGLSEYGAEGIIVFIIAEAGVNHNGDIEIAKKLIDAASEAGVDAVKFQTFKAEKLVCAYAEKADPGRPPH